MWWVQRTGGEGRGPTVGPGCGHQQTGTIQVNIIITIPVAITIAIVAIGVPQVVAGALRAVESQIPLKSPGEAVPPPVDC